MSGIVRYEKRPEPRLSRASLRAWLESGGPKSLAQIHAWAKLQLASIKRADVLEILQAHPRLFSEYEEGIWGATHEATEYRRSKPRRAQASPAPLRKIKRTVSENGRRRPDPPPQVVPQPSKALVASGGLLVEAGVLTEVLFRREVAGAEPHETSGMILLHLPQDGRLSAASLEHAMTWISSSIECRVFEALPDSPPLFRGTRRVAHASIMPDDGRIRVVFDRAADDAAPRRAFALRAVSSGSTSTSVILAKAGVPARDEAAVIRSLPARIQRAVEAPLQSHKYDPARATIEAQPRLRAVANDPSQWPDFVQWLEEQRLVWGRQAMEEVVAQTLALRGIAKDDLGLAAYLALGTEPIARTATARAIMRLVAATENEWLCRWAISVCTVTFSPPETPGGDLALARAKAASRCGAYADACADFEAAVLDGESLEPLEVAEYLFCAAASQESKAMRKALSFWDHLIGEHFERECFIRYYPSFESAFDMARQLQEKVGPRFEQLLQAEIENDEERAVDTARTHIFGDTLKLRRDEIFSSLSILESMENLSSLEALADLMSELLSKWSKVVRPGMVGTWIDQLRLVERLISEQTPRSEFHQRNLLAATDSTPVVSDSRERPLEGRRIALIGGRASTRSRSESLFLELGAKGVEHVPASFDDGIGHARLGAVLESVTDVVLITDYVKHDVQAVLRNKKTDICFASGGPSRILGRLLTHLSGTAS